MAPRVCPAGIADCVCSEVSPCQKPRDEFLEDAIAIFDMMSIDNHHAPKESDKGITAFYGFREEKKMTVDDAAALIADLKVSSHATLPRMVDKLTH